MSKVSKQKVVGTREAEEPATSWRSFLPAILAVAGTGLMVLLRLRAGGDHFISDGALMLLALASYLTAAVFHLMNLYAPSEMAQKVGLWLAMAGVFFNLSSWCVRWVTSRENDVAMWIQQGKPLSELPWFFRSIPFSNLYDLSVAFAFGAGITTLLIAHRKSFRFLGALSLPLASIILLLARFIGDELINLQPILDSYWRPIHVGIASLSYGVALVCFAIGVVYLLKDGVKTEAMAICTSLFSLFVLSWMNWSLRPFSIFTSFSYSASTTLTGTRMSIPLRVEIPYVGPALVLASLMLIGVIVLFTMYLKHNNEQARMWGHRLLKAAFVVQACAVALLVSQIKTMTNVVSRIDTSQYARFGAWVAEKVAGMTTEQIKQLSPSQLEQISQQFIADNGSRLALSLNANPVELASLITIAAGTLFVIIFSFRTEKLKEALPPLEKLDSLMYKTASVAFAMLAMLLITGAVWANESWGAYWSWDSKEVGALVAWLTYAAYLHTRIAHGWTGRRSAYFALVGFLLVIFTYLGVSYLLPGLHSYA